MTLTQDLINVTHEVSIYDISRNFSIYRPDLEISEKWDRRSATYTPEVWKRNNESVQVKNAKLENHCWILIQWYKHCVSDITSGIVVHEMERLL